MLKRSSEKNTALREEGYAAEDGFCRIMGISLYIHEEYESIIWKDYGRTEACFIITA